MSLEFGPINDEIHLRTRGCLEAPADSWCIMGPVPNGVVQLVVVLFPILSFCVFARCGLVAL